MLVLLTSITIRLTGRRMLIFLKSMTIRLTGRMMLIFNIHDNQQIKLILWTDQEVTHTYITMNIYMNPLTYTHMHACEYTESTNALMLFSIKDRYLVMIICILKKKKQSLAWNMENREPNISHTVEKFTKFTSIHYYFYFSLMHMYRMNNPRWSTTPNTLVLLVATSSF